jgi:hypothetical protein
VSFTFDPRRRLIPVDVEIVGPKSPVYGRLLLDTGSVYTLVHPGLLAKAGYDSSAHHSRVSIVGVSSTTEADLHIVSRLSALGVDRSNIAVLAHRLPGSLPFDGLLGCELLPRPPVVD